MFHSSSPQSVGSLLEDLVRVLHDELCVKVVVVCGVIPRGTGCHYVSHFNDWACKFNQYVKVVLEPLPYAFQWSHRRLNDFLLTDGVHLNPVGQYHLYRSYRGAILKALGVLNSV
jgi:hypothetical protein